MFKVMKHSILKSAFPRKTQIYSYPQRIMDHTFISISTNTIKTAISTLLMNFKKVLNYLLHQYLFSGKIFHQVYPIVCGCQHKITNGFRIRYVDVIVYNERAEIRINIFVYITFFHSAFLLYRYTRKQKFKVSQDILSKKVTFLLLFLFFLEILLLYSSMKNTRNVANTFCFHCHFKMLF